MLQVSTLGAPYLRVKIFFLIKWLQGWYILPIALAIKVCGVIVGTSNFAYILSYWIGLGFVLSLWHNINLEDCCFKYHKWSQEKYRRSKWRLFLSSNDRTCPPKNVHYSTCYRYCLYFEHIIQPHWSMYVLAYVFHISYMGVLYGKVYVENTCQLRKMRIAFLSR